MKGDFDWGNLVHWARLDLGFLDADYSISDRVCAGNAGADCENGNDGSAFDGVSGGLRNADASHVKDAGEMEEVEKRELTPDEVLEQEELAEAMIRLVRFLERSEDRAMRLIFRCYIEGVSYEHLAVEERTTRSNMRTRVSRAIASRRQTLIDVYRESERVEEAGRVAVEFMQFTEEQYQKIAPYLPGQRGNVRISNLQMRNAPLYTAENGCKWKSLPYQFGLWNTISMRMSRWAKNGVWDRECLNI